MEQMGEGGGDKWSNTHNCLNWCRKKKKLIPTHQPKKKPQQAQKTNPPRKGKKRKRKKKRDITIPGSTAMHSHP